MKKIIFILVLFLLNVTVFAQVKILRNITIEDGLAQSNVNSIYQDSNGYMWFGTMHGLTRWDGIYYRNYDLIDGLSGAGISVISEDNFGKVLIGTDLGLSVFFNYKISSPKLPDYLRSKQIVSLYTDSKNQTYIGTTSGLLKMKDGVIDTLFYNSGIGNKFIYAINGYDDKVFMAVRNLGFIKIENNKVEIISDSHEFNLGWGNAIADSKNRIIINTRKGIAIYKEKLEFINLRKKNAELRFRKIIQGDDDEIFITTNRGVLKYKNSKTEYINDTNGLPSNNIISVCRDNTGVYYFGLQGDGVALYDGGRIFSLNRETGFKSNRIYGICEGYDGNIFFASSTGGIQVYNNKEVKTISRKDGFPTNFVNDVKAFDENSIIAATDVGLIKYFRNGKMKVFNRESGLKSNYFREVLVDENKTIYAANALGVHIINGNDYKIINKKNGLPSELVSSMIKLKDDTFVFGTDDKGIVYYKNGVVRQLSKVNGLSDNKVLCLYQSKDGTVMAGTQGGLSIILEKEIKVFNTLNGLTDNTIYAINEDNFGNIYLTTNRGVDILTFENDKVSIRNISLKNGLAGNECNIRGLCKDSEGRMWIGTLKGASCYDPSKDNIVKNPPEVKLTSVRLYDEIVDDFYTEEKLVFEHNENFLRFRFLGVNLTSPNEVKYQYRLTTVDPEWVESDFRFARYANLSNGDYKFEVRAKNTGGEWSEIKSVSFTILAPFYKSWWFIILSISVIAGTVILFIAMRVRQVIQFERLRTKLSADLHDNVGAGLTEISILSEVIAHAKERNNEDVTRNLNLISRIAREMVDSMSDIVWLVNPKRDSLYDLIIRLEETYREIFNQKGIAFQSKNLTSLETISLPMEYRQHLYLIFKEGINNSLKYSDCSKIFLDAEVDGKKIIMRLSDDGVGFDMAENHSGQGLKNMSERSNLINGLLNISSNNGEGTKIIFEGKIAG